jgi:hypothetical protein
VSSGESFSLDLGTRTFQFSHLPWFIIVSCFAIEFRVPLEVLALVYWTKVQYTRLPLCATKASDEESEVSRGEGKCFSSLRTRHLQDGKWLR